MGEIDTMEPADEEHQAGLRALETAGLVSRDGQTLRPGPNWETLVPVVRALDAATAESDGEPSVRLPASLADTPVRGNGAGTRGGFEVVGTVAHDMRGPLSKASGWLGLAREDGDAEQFDALEAALAQLGERVEDMVQMAGDGAEPHERQLRAVSLPSTAERVWRDRPTDAGELVVETDRSVRAVPDRLERLLQNLFENSLEHGADDREPTVRVGLLDGGFYVEDDGVGIPPSEHERVFDLGYTSESGGRGLGLTSVAQVATAHGWAVRLTESAEGGVRFEFTGVEVDD